MRAVNFSLTILAPVGHPDRIDSLRDESVLSLSSVTRP